MHPFSRLDETNCTSTLEEEVFRHRRESDTACALRLRGQHPAMRLAATCRCANAAERKR